MNRPEIILADGSLSVNINWSDSIKELSILTNSLFRDRL